jgi:hypothetical protein
VKEGLYLLTTYVDGRRGERRERHYADNGEVWVVVDGERSLRCTFDEAQVCEARRAIEESGLTTTQDTPPSGVHDGATMIYEWRLGQRRGRVVDEAYPAVVPPAFDRLETRLMELETESLADP